MQLQVGVKAFALNSDGKFLLMRRTAKNYPGAKGLWDWDIIGGRIEPNTSLRENLIREIHEETQLVFDGPMKLIAAQDIFPDSGDRHVVRLTYLININGIPKLNPEEHDEFAWVSPQELKTWPNLDKNIQAIVKEGLLDIQKYS